MVSKRKIEFHGKEMNLLQAKLYLFGLSHGIIKASLNYKEESGYLNEKKREKEKGSIAREYLSQKSIENAIPRLNERKYICGILERRIKEEELLRKEDFCKQYGHKKGEPFKSWMANSETQTYICSRCRVVYEEGTNKIVTPPFEPPKEDRNI